MRILRVGFDVRKGEQFRIGWYVGEVIFRIGDCVLSKDVNSGAKRMRFKIYEDLR